MKNADTTNLLTLIDSADEHGRVYFRVPNKEPVRTKEQAREYLLTVFMYNAAVTLRLEKVKKFITEVDLERKPDGESHTALSLNLAKLLLLPGIAPAEELAAFREVVLELRAFHEAHPTENCDVQVCNHRDRNGRVYGTIACRLPSKTQEHMAEQDKAATQALNERIESNQVLVHWLRQMALALQKIGPWASALIRQDDLFGYSNGPYSKHIMAQIIAKSRASAPAPQLVPLDI